MGRARQHDGDVQELVHGCQRGDKLPQPLGRDAHPRRGLTQRGRGLQQRELGRGTATAKHFQFTLRDVHREPFQPCSLQPDGVVEEPVPRVRRGFPLQPRLRQAPLVSRAAHQ